MAESNIERAIRRHEELKAAGKGAVVPNPPALESPIIPPAPVGTGIPGPVRGSYTPNQVLDTDFNKANTINGPLRSPMFPIPQNPVNNTAAVQAALQAAAAKSKTTTSQGSTAVPTTPVAPNPIPVGPPHPLPPLPKPPILKRCVYATPTGVATTFTSPTTQNGAQNVSHRVYRNTINDFSSATAIAQHGYAGDGMDVEHQDVPANGVTNYYWATVTDNFGQESSPTALQCGSPTGSGSRLNTSGQLINADQVAGDGSTYIRRPQNSGSAIVLDNANFVAGTSGWSVQGNATIAQDTTAPTTNGKSLKVTTASQFNGAAHVAQFKASPGDVFFMSAWMKSDGVFEPKFQISYIDGSGAFLNSDGIGFSTSTTWTQYTGTGGAAPANTATVQILLGRVDSGVLSQSAWLAEPHVVRAANLTNEVVDTPTHVRLLASHASGNVAYNFKGAWSSATSYVIADEVTFGNIYWIALAANSNSQPSISNVNWQAVGRIQGDIQSFTASGIWSKPAAGSFAVITVIGGGGGGGRGAFNTNTSGIGNTAGRGGGGGGVSVLTVPLSVLGATETVTVGTGGAGDSGSGAGAGGTTSFGAWIRAFGGGAGNPPSGNNPGPTAVGGSGNFGVGGGSGAQGTGMAAGGGGDGGKSVELGGIGTSFNGANGASGPQFRGTVITGGAGGSGSDVGSATAGSSATGQSTDEPTGGAGAGGGGGSSAGTGGTGGSCAATCYGAGGGGGGGTANPTGGSGGAGGQGAPGLVVISVF